MVIVGIRDIRMTNTKKSATTLQGRSEEKEEEKEEKQQCFPIDTWHKKFHELKNEIIRLTQNHRHHEKEEEQEVSLKPRQRGASGDEPVENSSSTAVIIQNNDQSNSFLETSSSSSSSSSNHEQDCLPHYISLESLQVTNPKIAKWISEQKSSAKKWEAGLDSSMTQERLDLLHSISFFQIFQNKYDEGWNEQFERLQKHYLETGNLNVKEHDLKRWMRKQKQEYDAFESMHFGSSDHDIALLATDSISSSSSSEASKTKATINAIKTTMTRERMDKLDSIHFSSYNPSTCTSDPKFESRLEELKKYQLQHGHLRVPKNCPSNKSLGRWVTRIRAQYRLYKEGKSHCGVISESRIEQLESIGFEWQSTSKFTANVTWDTRFQELVEYQKKHQSTNVPGRYKANPTLGTWVRNQRCQYWAKKRGKRSPMTEKRIEKLESIGFRW